MSLSSLITNPMPDAAVQGAGMTSDVIHSPQRFTQHDRRAWRRRRSVRTVRKQMLRTD